jgi:P pilus assembly chaperone PapD
LVTILQYNGFVELGEIPPQLLKRIAMFTWKPAKIVPAVIAAASVLAIPMLLVSPAKAAGDLLVAPTRVVLDGRRGTEVILNNIGTEEATYRISLELRRMNAQGRLEDVVITDANDFEKNMLGMVRFAPKRVTLPPNQPQSIRIGIQPTDQLPDGEYRAHMLFRAIPKVQPVTTAKASETGVQIQIIPVYGVTIPIIVRKGKLEAVAAIANPRLGKDNKSPTLEFDLSRKGTRSVFGEVRVSKPGVTEPVFEARGIAIYTEINQRVVSIPINQDVADKIRGPVTIGYYETPEAGGGLIAEVKSVLP